MMEAATTPDRKALRGIQPDRRRRYLSRVANPSRRYTLGEKIDAALDSGFTMDDIKSLLTAEGKPIVAYNLTRRKGRSEPPIQPSAERIISRVWLTSARGWTRSGASRT
jgi:hypothetical protein